MMLEQQMTLTARQAPGKAYDGGSLGAQTLRWC
jgi:hypothetical protein